MTNSEQKPPILWVQTLLFSITLLIALIAVPWYGFAAGYHWTAWLGLVLFLGANGMSITAGYHRLWAHNAYKAHPLMRLIFALFGAAALQNSILVWASGHRRHHRHVDDTELDPYSAKLGLWYSHIGWMLRNYPSGQDDFSNAQDLQRDPIVVWQHRHYGLLAIVMNLLPPLLLGWLTGDYLANLLLAGVLRLVLSHHTTFFINSLAHYWGKQPYTDSNSARDNGILALLTYGEGYHNYHHLFQNDYRNGVRWWQFDPTKWLIQTSAWLGLASELKRTPAFKIREAIVSRQFKRAESLLSRMPNTDAMHELIDQEYQHFVRCLQEWKSLREGWMQHKRQALADAKQELVARWQQNAVRTRFKELEYALKMQQKRLQFFNLQLA